MTGFSPCHGTSHAKCPSADNSKQFTDATVELCLSLSLRERGQDADLVRHRHLCPDRRHRERTPTLLRLAFSLCLTTSLVLHGQGLTTPGPADNPFASDKSDSLSGLSSGRSFDPYSGEKRHDRVPAMQKEFTDVAEQEILASISDAVH
jgi:hypothetical protein